MDERQLAEIASWVGWPLESLRRRLPPEMLDLVHSLVAQARGWARLELEFEAARRRAEAEDEDPGTQPHETAVSGRLSVEIAMDGVDAWATAEVRFGDWQEAERFGRHLTEKRPGGTWYRVIDSERPYPPVVYRFWRGRSGA